MNGPLFTLLLSTALLLVPALCANRSSSIRPATEREATYAMVGEDATSTYYYLVTHEVFILFTWGCD
jgi:hypothetical protein